MCGCFTGMGKQVTEEGGTNTRGVGRGVGEYWVSEWCRRRETAGQRGGILRNSKGVGV